MPLQIVKEDILHIDADAVVNAADFHGGACIFGKIGQAEISKSFKPHSKYIIHVACPVWEGGNNGEEELLRSCYRSALKIAKEYKLNSIAISAVLSEKSGYPEQAASSVAISEISEFLAENDMLIYLAVQDKKAFGISQDVLNSVADYIDDKYIESVVERRQSVADIAYKLFSSVANRLDDSRMESEESIDAPKSVSLRKLEDVMGQLEESFSESLLRLIDQKGKKDVEVYKRANIDRKHFSKIRSNKDYKPTKPTVLAFAVALELSLDETKDLLARAGFALTHSSKFDIVVEYFIKEKNYNIFEINQALFAFDLPILI